MLVLPYYVHDYKAFGRITILGEFLAVGTQMKTERPGKACGVVPVDSIEGPTVRMQNGDVLRIDEIRIGIEADNVHGAEGGRFRQAHDRPGQQVDLLDAVTVFHHPAEHGHGEKGSDAVGNKVGRVVGANDSLSEHAVSKV